MPYVKTGLSALCCTSLVCLTCMRAAHAWFAKVRVRLIWGSLVCPGTHWNPVSPVYLGSLRNMTLPPGPYPPRNASTFSLALCYKSISGHRSSLLVGLESNILSAIRAGV